MNLLLSLLLGHIFGDFYFQTKEMAQNKSTNLYKHVGIYTLIMSIAYLINVRNLSVIIFIPLIALTHYYIDLYGMRESIQSRFNSKPLTLFVFDQLLHLIVIVGFVLFYKLGIQQQFFDSANPILLLIVIVLNLIMPCGVFIDKLMSQLMNENVGPFEYSEGVIIGIAERLIVFFLALVGNLSALGFILAAKTMVRYGQFEEKDSTDNKVGDMTFRNKYLIGTLMSILLTLIHVAIFLNFQIIEIYIDSLVYFLIN